MRAAVFLDKDGTLVQDVPYNVDIGQIALCEGAVEAMQLLTEHGYALIVVSNQPGLALGKFDDLAFGRARRRLTEMFKDAGVTLDGFYHCPHHPEGTVATYAQHCICRKPLPGMLLRAAQELMLDLHDSWMVGDILNDVEAGHRAGCKSVLIDNGNETQWHMSPLRRAEAACPDLVTAAQFILSCNGRKPLKA